MPDVTSNQRAVTIRGWKHEWSGVWCEAASYSDEESLRTSLGSPAELVRWKRRKAPIVFAGLAWNQDLANDCTSSTGEGGADLDVVQI